MEWMLVLLMVLAYTPVIYKLNRRIYNLEEEVRELKKYNK